MGCEVLKLDTGTKIDIHRFDNAENAKQYVEVGRRYVLDRIDSWMGNKIFYYTGPNVGELAAVRRESNDIWRASFWLNDEPAPVAVIRALKKIRKESECLKTKWRKLQTDNEKMQSTVLSQDRLISVLRRQLAELQSAGR